MSAESDNTKAQNRPSRQNEVAMRITGLFAQAQNRYRAAGKKMQIGLLAGAGILVFMLISLFSSSSAGIGAGTVFEVRQGAFDVIVREGGNIEALQSQQIRSSVRGNQGVKILAIVEEGYRVTSEDVINQKILVELDSSSLEEQKLNQEIAYETAEAQYIERKAQLEIRINQNVSSLNSATQKMKFARLDFERFLGAKVVADLVARLSIEERLARSEQRVAPALGAPMDNRLEQIAQTRQARQQGRRPDSGTAVPANVADLSQTSQIPAQFRERMEQMRAENGGTIPPEILQRMQSGGGGRSNGAARSSDFQSTGSADAATDTMRVDDFQSSADVAEPELADLELAEITMPEVPTMLMDASYLAVRSTLDFTVYADESELEDGEAKQRLRTLQENVRVAEENYLQALAKLEGQRRLAAREFITPNDLEVEESRLLQAESKLEQARTEMALYTQYTFPKDAEQQLANYEDAIMSFQRTKAEGDSELAQSQARYKSAERRLNLEAERLADINEQLAMTVIRAQRPGLVVYGSADQASNPFRGGSSQEPIAEGATVRERQPILTIPDMTEMAVRVNIHESAVQRVAEGQKVTVRIDAFPNILLTGEVTKVAVVADSGNAFMNPDMKVYPTMVKIDGIHDWLRPGMSAEVEILVDSLSDAVYVPLQAVTYVGDRQVVYVAQAGRGVPRDVQVGTFSEQFIEIVAGLRKGEQVMLLPPRQLSGS
jgi:multidrug resistance efflux pump